MKDVKKILFPTDLSQHARYAFNFAASLADHYGASIAILHVFEQMPGFIESSLSGLLGEKKWEEIRKQNEEEAREILIGKKRDKVMIEQALKSFAQEAKNDEPWRNVATDEIVVKEGHIADEIVEQAASSGCDLIVMAYYSRNMVADAMMGSVTRRVLRRSKKPVLLVPMPNHE
jgi:nucleotide-binding universal stress UspA family protein